MMLTVWALCVGLFVALPFHIVNREITTYGFIMLFLSIMCFCFGAWMRAPVLKQRHAPVIYMPDFRRVEPILIAVAVLAMIVLFVEWRSGSGGDLDAAWQIRSDRSTSLLNGTESGSSLTFQLGFLLSPVGYVIIAKELIYHEKTRLWRLLGIGFGPLILSSLALGGRGPLLLGFTVAALSFSVRQTIFRYRTPNSRRTQMSSRTVFLLIVAVVGGLVALNYFATVFIVRAESGGGTQAVFEAIGDNWGVSFDGPVADSMKQVIGIGNTYLVFVFSWYLVQGLVISNVLFTSYTGPAQFGLYGIELAGALVRRFDGQLVANQNLSLLDLNVFGFLPTAFGTLYVDYWFFGLAIAAGWGYLAATVYARCRTSADARWALIAPFVMQGVIFSVINTPFGATNGFVTHVWMLFVFLMIKPRKRPAVMKGTLLVDKGAPAAIA